MGGTYNNMGSTGPLNSLAAQGRNGDTELAHVNPQEKAVLSALGGSGGINPQTGLREFYTAQEKYDSYWASQAAPKAVVNPVPTYTRKPKVQVDLDDMGDPIETQPVPPDAALERYRNELIAAGTYTPELEAAAQAYMASPEYAQRVAEAQARYDIDTTQANSMGSYGDNGIPPFNPNDPNSPYAVNPYVKASGFRGNVQEIVYADGTTHQNAPYDEQSPGPFDGGLYDAMPYITAATMIAAGGMYALPAAGAAGAGGAGAGAAGAGYSGLAGAGIAAETGITGAGLTAAGTGAGAGIAGAAGAGALGAAGAAGASGASGAAGGGAAGAGGAGAGLTTGNVIGGISAATGVAGLAGAGGSSSDSTPMVYGSPEMLQAGADLGLTPEQTLSLSDQSLGGLSAYQLAGMGNPDGSLNLKNVPSTLLDTLIKTGVPLTVAGLSSYLAGEQQSKSQSEAFDRQLAAANALYDKQLAASKEATLQSQEFWRKNAFMPQEAVDAYKKQGMAGLNAQTETSNKNFLDAASARGFQGGGMLTSGLAGIERNRQKQYGSFVNNLTQYANTPRFSPNGSPYSVPSSSVPTATPLASGEQNLYNLLGGVGGQAAGMGLYKSLYGDTAPLPNPYLYPNTLTRGY